MTVEQADTSTVETYVYAVMRAGAKHRLPGAGVGPLQASLRTVTRNGLSAVVSSVPDGDLAVTREDLFRHTEILQSLMRAGTILPLRFGTIMPDERTVADELLDARHGELEELLNTLGGKVELSLSASYHESVLREVVTESPEIADLNRRVQALSPDAGYYERIRLGEFVAQAFERKRDRDSASIIERLGPHAVDVVVGQPAHERAVLNAAFLVDEQRLPEFDAAANAVADEHRDRMRFRYTGPLPPFSFVQLQEGAEWG